jgi:hypothetical protein
MRVELDVQREKICNFSVKPRLVDKSRIEQKKKY